MYTDTASAFECIGLACNADLCQSYPQAFLYVLSTGSSLFRSVEDKSAFNQGWSFCEGVMEPSCRREELIQERATVDAELADLRRRLKNAQHQAAAAERKRKRQWQLPEDLKRVVVILYHKGHPDPRAAATFLASAASKRNWEERPEADVRKVVEDTYLGISVEDLVSLCDADRPSDPKAMRTALRHWEEWRLFHWVKETNERKGVAPSTQAVLDQLERRYRELPEDLRPQARGMAHEAKERMFALRLRRRWGMRHGSIRAREDISIEEMRAKARHMP